MTASAVLAALAAATASAQVRTFDNPQHDGLAVSYCGADSNSCGEYSATAWCVAMGYQHATDWSARAGFDGSTRVVRLDDGAVCEGAACESFARISCETDSQPFTTPVLGPSGNMTLLLPDRRALSQSIDASEYRLLLPGCAQYEPGVFLCNTIDEYEHCRTLMVARLIHSCRANVAFEGIAASPYRAAANQVELSVDSDAIVRIGPASRGWGQIKGDARVLMQFELPPEADASSCRERVPYLYYPTGAEGGRARIGEADGCDVPMELTIEVNEDDLLRAYDQCDAFAAWGEELEDSMEVLVAGLYVFAQPGPSGGEKVIAPYAIVEAPLTIECQI